MWLQGPHGAWTINQKCWIVSNLSQGTTWYGPNGIKSVSKVTVNCAGVDNTRWHLRLIHIHFQGWTSLRNQICRESSRVYYVSLYVGLSLKHFIGLLILGLDAIYHLWLIYPQLVLHYVTCNAGWHFWFI